jgi:alkylation response protein AidB-like acyl-CoA dehydrogenase
LLLFGSEAQKQKYLPKLLSGQLIGAYGLSETGSGSDALGARTRAARQADGSFLLNGEKMWITNGGFADLFVVFAKVDGEQFTAFLVERAFGVKSGKEEHKMGLHGSSTTALIFQDVKVPAENVLGEVGKGHKVAFNVLNFARFKLGAMCGGGAHGAIAESAKYAASRRQFGQPIASFGAIKHKIGEMVVRTYAIESLLYRTAGLVDARIDATPHEATDGGPALAAFEEYAVEASIAQSGGQRSVELRPRREHPDPRRQRLRARLPGGAPFPRRARQPHLRRHQRDQPPADSRHVIRRAVKGDLPLIPAAKALQDELMGPAAMPAADDAVLGEELRTWTRSRRLA